MIIGDSPEEQKDLQSDPFSGNSGQLLTKILNSVGINRETDAYIANLVKCGQQKDSPPEIDEIESCKPYLIRQIQLVQPKILILLGEPALKTILEKNKPLTEVRGNWYTAPVDYMEEPLYIMPLFHPSFLLKNQSKAVDAPKRLTWHDMKEVKTALDFYKC